METIKIDAGWANGWSNAQSDWLGKIETKIKETPGFKQAVAKNGSTETYTFSANGIVLTYKVDMS